MTFADKYIYRWQTLCPSKLLFLFDFLKILPNEFYILMFFDVIGHLKEL